MKSKSKLMSLAVTGMISSCVFAADEYRKAEVVRQYEIDTAQFPAVVIESDDWGVEQGNKITETPERLQRIFDLLAKHHGADGLPAVITAFTCMANPDFEAIRANKFTEYRDIPISRSAPKIVSKYQQGIAAGVWSAEYHANLHHISPRLWLELLKEDSAAGEEARRRFDQGTYAQKFHIPEYEGYTLPEQFQVIQTGFSRFKEMFGHLPEVAVTSDAYPETVMLWAVAGVHAAGLTNTRLNTGEVTVYHTKPWNFQDIYARMGDYNPKLDLVYLTRNLNFEVETLGNALKYLERTFNKNREPAVIQLHRGYICHSDDARVKERVELLDQFLGKMSERGVIFITSGELASLYRQGYSLRKVGTKTVFRKWSKVKPPAGITEAYRLPEMKKVKITEKTLGNFVLEQ